MTPQETLAICGYALTPGHFSSRTVNVITPDFQVFDLMADVFYLSASGTLYKLARGSVSDLASVPKPFWNLLPPQGTAGAEYALAAFGHDCAYRNTLRVWNGSAWVLAALSKSDCDSLLKEMMLACQVPEVTAETIYQGVNLAGSHAFNEDR